MPAKNQILSLYHALLKDAKQLTNYNFRSYAVRRIKYDFRKNLLLGDSEAKSAYKSGLSSQQVLRRQRIISQLYPEDDTVIEVKNST